MEQQPAKRVHVQDFHHNGQLKRSFEHAQEFSSRKRCRLEKNVSGDKETRLYSEMEVNNIKQAHYAQIITLRHQLEVLKRQLQQPRIRSSAQDDARQNANLKQAAIRLSKGLEGAET